MIFYLLAAKLAVGQHSIYPGLHSYTPHWNDTDGNRIEAHAAGMFQVNISHKSMKEMVLIFPEMMLTRWVVSFVPPSSPRTGPNLFKLVLVR